MAYTYWLSKGNFEAAQIPTSRIMGIDRAPFQSNESVEEAWLAREDYKKVAGLVRTKNRLKIPCPRRCNCPKCITKI